jgi:DNA topoisomerase-1
VAKNLIIVESPAKAKTLKRFLGSNFQVSPSVGHIMDLPKNRLGVDIDHDFKPEYHVIPGKAKVITDIKKAALGKERVYLATDPDREGEAIAWHIAEKLNLPSEKLGRILLHEITAAAVKEAVAHPTTLNPHLYEAQQARRVLDRLVGYQISPLLWEKVKRGLSAGRVQSVALRIVVDREREREAFRAEEYWTVDAALEAQDPPPFKASLYSFRGQRIDNKDYKLGRDEAYLVVESCRSATFRVQSIESKEVRRNPAPPFITSRLQQEAARKLRFSPSRTMKIAQRLYEGVNLGDEGPTGLITYMRTDSPRVSDQALQSVREFITQRYGADYLPERPNVYRAAKSAQEAHEAIRPTAVARDPESVAPYLERDELALYMLIFNRFVASQMRPALYDRTVVDIEAERAIFRATGQVLKFDGFMRAYTEGQDDGENGLASKKLSAESQGDASLPALVEGQVLKLLELTPEQHFTQPPPRFTQATLIKELEDKGIGRPSTYATIMTSILDRSYVEEDENKRLRPTTLGRTVSDLLIGSFPDIIETSFTASLEDELDQIEEGRENWVAILRRFYGPFSARLGEAEKNMPDIKRAGLKTDIKCELDGGTMVIKWGRNGEFLACSNYPKCRNTKQFTRDEQGRIQATQDSKMPQMTQELCAKCGRPMVLRRSRYGAFLGCSGYPECDGVKKLGAEALDIGVKCPECGRGNLLQRRSRRQKIFYGCSRYPACKFASWDKPVLQQCPKCEAPYLAEKPQKNGAVTLACVNQNCDYKTQAEATQDLPAGSAPPPNT